MTKNRSHIVIALSILFLLLLPPAPAGEGEEVSILIVFPGGPPDSRVAPYIGDLAGLIADGMGISPRSLRVEYFSLAGPALEYLRRNPDSFIIGSAGFFLSRRQELSLVPLAAVEMDTGNEGRYHLIVKKGSFRELEELKGKTVAGSTLYEDPVFLRTLVFENRIDPESDLLREPTSRPLTAIRRLARGEVGAVLLDDLQLESLRSLPLFEEVSVIYRSPPLPEVGLMMVDTTATRRRQEGFLAALEGLGETEEGGRAFGSFGLRGFRRIDPGSLEEAIRKYETGRTGESR